MKHLSKMEIAMKREPSMETKLEMRKLAVMFKDNRRGINKNDSKVCSK